MKKLGVTMSENCTNATGGILSSPNFDIRSFIFEKELQPEETELNKLEICTIIGYTFIIMKDV